jgi:hypothetical protein
MRTPELPMRLAPLWLPNSWLVVDCAGQFRDVSETTCLDLGYSRDELLQLAMQSIDPGFDPLEVRKSIEASPAAAMHR